MKYVGYQIEIKNIYSPIFTSGIVLHIQLVLLAVLELFSFESCGALLLLHVDEICDVTGCKTRSYPAARHETETGSFSQQN